MSAIKARWQNAFVIVTLICSQPLLASDREERLNAGLAALKREHYATALRSWLPLAEAGDPEAQANVGYMYEEGLGVSQQLDVAVGWYEKAAASGSMQANHNLGMIFAEGRGAPQSWVRALRYFEEAANDIPASRYMIGYTYFQGEGNIQNRPRAFREFMDAALDGYADAQYMIAFMYLDGSGIPKQPIQAYVWARLAHDNNQSQAAELVDAASNRISSGQAMRADGLVRACIDATLEACAPAIAALE
jgi:TPR repeat protein